MSALRQMRRVLQDDGHDVHAIATAINLHLGVTKMPTLDSLLDDMKANIDKGLACFWRQVIVRDKTASRHRPEPYKPGHHWPGRFGRIQELRDRPFNRIVSMN